jgi:hypothetical protein
MAVFWVVVSCRLVEVYRFRGPCCLHHQCDDSRFIKRLYFIALLTASNGRIIILYYESERIWKKAVVDFMNMLSEHLTRHTSEDNEMP